MVGKIPEVEINSQVMKKIRFAALVAKLGAPVMVSLWQDPEQHAPLQKAIKENRVVSIFQPNVGTTKDAGEIGFKKGRHMAYVIFPEEIAERAGTPVIGIKYDLIQQPKVEDPIRITETRKTSEPKQKQTEAKAKPQPKQYAVDCVCTAKDNVRVHVTAHTLATAKKEAKRLAPGQVRFEEGAITVKVIKASVA